MERRRRRHFRPTKTRPISRAKEMDNCDVRFSSTDCGASVCGGDLFRGLPLKNLHSLFLPFVVTTSRRARFDRVVWASLGPLRTQVRAAKMGL